MKLKARRSEDKRGVLPISILKAGLISLCVSLVGILIFAFLLKFTSISDKFISPINQVIKGVSIFLGVFLGFRKQKSMGLVGGLLVGLFYTLIAFICFSLLDGNFVFDRTLLNDSIFGSIIGAICGIICVNLKKTSL